MGKLVDGILGNVTKCQLWSVIMADKKSHMDIFVMRIERLALMDSPDIHVFFCVGGDAACDIRRTTLLPGAIRRHSDSTTF